MDLKDRKILSELDFDARKSIVQIAKKVGVSKEVSLYRIKKLKREGVIKQYYAVINSAKLGYYYCRLLVRFQNISDKMEREIVNYLKKSKKIAYVGLLDGSWDLLFGYWARDISEFGGFINGFVFRYGKYILEKEISVGTHLSQFQYRFLLNKKETKEFESGGFLENLKVDEVDKKLLSLLTENARINYEELSKKLGLTGKAITYRIRNLVSKKIIVGFRTLIDYKKFGFANNKVFLYLQNLTKKDYSELLSYIKELKNCIYITRVVGKADLEFEVLTKNREEFFQIIRKLRAKFSKIIRRYDSYVIHEEPISRFVPLDL